MSKFTIFFALFFLVIPDCSYASFYTGNELLDLCNNKNFQQQALCLGLVVGYFEGMETSYDCPRAHPKVTAGQLVDIVTKFLKNNPEVRNMPGSILAMRSYVVAFSCTKHVDSK